MKKAKSDIPNHVTEISIGERKSADYQVVNCFLGKRLVGKRVYNFNGVLIIETPLVDGIKHGREINWDDSGKIISIEPYVNGKMHGIAKQIGKNGQIIGTNRFSHGTGYDIWRQENEDGKIYVTEIHTLKDGLPHGYEWWFASEKKDLFHERHWQSGKLHGIERVWNHIGKLKRGYPKFFISDQLVSKQKYIKATFADGSLPKYFNEDNSPYRKLPLEL